MTLPMTNSGDFHLEADAARKYGLALANNYQSSLPFPHAVIDNFLPHVLATRLTQEFPTASRVEHHLYDIGYRGSLKRQYSPEKCSTFCRHFFMFLNSGPFLEFLGALSGCAGLIGDPYFEGGGFHETLSGGKLGIHRDFRIHKRLNLLRRLNFIVYLNEEWQEDYGGLLELWSRDMENCVKRVVPVFNRCVIFSTDDTSFHGHPEPLNTSPGTNRKSIATYYYTASEKVLEEVRFRRTHFVPRPGENPETVQELLLIQEQQPSS